MLWMTSINMMSLDLKSKDNSNSQLVGNSNMKAQSTPSSSMRGQTTADIVSLETAIKSNAVAIKDLNDKAANAAFIGIYNNGRIGSNINKITALETSDVNMKADITAHSKAISTNLTSISINSNMIEKNMKSIESNSVAISTVSKDNGSNSGGGSDSGGGDTNSGGVPANVPQIDKDAFDVQNKLRTDPKSFIP